MFQSKTLWGVHTELYTAETLELLKQKEVIRAINYRYKKRIEGVLAGLKERETLHEHRIAKAFGKDRSLVAYLQSLSEKHKAKIGVIIAGLLEERERAIFKFRRVNSNLPRREEGLEHVDEGLEHIERIVTLVLDLIAQDQESNGISLIGKGGGARFDELHDEIRFQLTADQNAKVRTIDSIILGVPYAAKYKEKLVITPMGGTIALEDFYPLKLVIPPDDLSKYTWEFLENLRKIADQRDKNSYLFICGGREAMYAMGVGEKFEISSVLEVFLEKRTMEFRIKNGKLI